MTAVLDAVPATGTPAPRPAPPPRRSIRRATLVFGSLIAGLVVMSVISVAVGSENVPLPQVLQVLFDRDSADPRWAMVIHDLRLPRTITAILVGAALGVAGLQMQTLFRNPLADPYILGASSGASLGVAIVVMLSGSGLSGFAAGAVGAGRTGMVLAAALGAAIVLILIVIMSRWVHSAVALLLIGVMLGTATTAAVSVMLVYTDPHRVQEFLVWGMGSFSATPWSDLRILAPVVAGGIVLALLTVRQLNALLMGERYAQSMGIRILTVRIVTVVSAAFLAGATTAFCGPIGFLGLVIPHLTRMAFGTANHRVLLPGVVLLGALLALVCAIIGQVPGTEIVLPINAVTSLVGAPVVIAVLLRSRRGSLGTP